MTFFFLLVTSLLLDVQSNGNSLTSRCLHTCVSGKRTSDNFSCLIHPHSLITGCDSSWLHYLLPGQSHWTSHLFWSRKILKLTPFFLGLVFQEIRNQSHECSYKVAKYPENRNRNRYRDVSPCRCTVQTVHAVRFMTVHNRSSSYFLFLFYAACSRSQPSKAGEHREWLHQCKSGSCGRSPEKVHIDPGKYPLDHFIDFLGLYPYCEGRLPTPVIFNRIFLAENTSL